MENKYVRGSWEDYFLEVMHAVSKRATCDRGRSGCVIARDNQILVTGYVGAPVGLPHCDDVGHFMVGDHCLRTVHAERNALNFAGRYGISVNGATAYITEAPCYSCAKDLASVGIKVVIISNRGYHLEEFEQILACIELFRECGISYWLFKGGMLLNLL